MARPESVALAGSYPTPPGVLPSLASLLEFEPAKFSESHVLVDPCAGEGEAIQALADRWFPPAADASCQLYAIELEAGRCTKLEARLGFAHVFHGDAFSFAIRGADAAGMGASLLFLNPPYDVDRIHRRLEQRFLERWTACLAPGAGLLVFLVPHYALAASAEYLARHYQDVRAWRFPPTHFGAYRQCCLVARRRAVAAPANDLLRRRIERWAADASKMPELETFERPLYQVRLDFPQLRLEPTRLDVARLVSDFEPWRDTPLVAAHRTVGEMIGAKHPVALPPRAAHIALALAAGMLNGKQVTPNRPGFPPLLIKGSLRREFVTTEERFNREGERVGSVQVQRPRLALHVLRLDTLAFHALRPGTHPSGTTELADFNTADLVEHYGQSLGRIMHEQLPALHDPANPAHAITLPRLARRPFRRQRDLICAGLKLFASGDNAIAAAEVGTGKSTVALSIGGALHPLHFQQTAAELRRVGFRTDRLRPVRRILVVCPPHLVGTWTAEAEAVLPLHRVVVVRTIADLDREGEIYLLSRETAKLGHGIAGILDDRCPRCGAPVELDPEELARTRARCRHVERTAQDRVARLAERLAAALRYAYPHEPHVRHLLSNRRILRLALPPLPEDGDAPAPSASPEPALLRPLAFELAALLEESFRTAPAYPLGAALHRLCLAASMQHEIHDWLLTRAQTYETRTRLPAPARDGADAAGSVRDLLQRLATEVLQPRPAYQTDPDALACLETLAAEGCWIETPPCGEPLFQATPEPRRYPLARIILRRHRSRFGLLVLDEAHELSGTGSAQEKAAHRLPELPGILTIALSGSLMGGYASSLFSNFWSLCRSFRREFPRDGKQAFVNRYGLRRVYVPLAEQEPAAVVAYGAVSDREQLREPPAVRQLGEAPGILPTFLLKYLLRVGLIMHKKDLEAELPRYDERPFGLELSDGDPTAAELAAEYHRLMRKLTARIRKDRYTPLAGRLWGAMLEMLSFPDRATGDLPPFVLRYPDSVGGAVIATAKQFPAAWLSPKERWGIERLREHMRDGHNTLILLKHTGKSGLARRYVRILRLHLGEDAIFLDAAKVRPEAREEWLNVHVIRPGCRILVTNAKTIATGLNNLVHFSRVLWPEGLDYDARLVRQGNGRVHRIGQTREVLVAVPFYRDTAQQTAFELVARKITASVQVDGLSIEGALESAGAGEDDESALAAMSMGQAIYEAWIAHQEPDS
jgi:Uncharacterised methyltransferase family (DUF6094)